MARVARFAPLLIAVVVAGCSADSATETTISSTIVERNGATSAPPTTGAGAVPAGGASDAPAAGYSAQAPPPEGFREADVAAPDPTLPLTVSINPGCVEHGRTTTVVLKTNRDVYVSAQVVFPASDHEHTPSRRGTADSRGRLTWKVPVDAAAGTGQASLLASARDPKSSSQGTSGTWHFVVAGAGGCPRS